MTMETKQLTAMLQEQFTKMTEGVNTLFEMDVDKEELWNHYLDSFPAGTNEIFRERREFDCNSCKQFIRLLGRIAVIKEGVITTLWDIEPNDSTFTPVVNAMRHFVATAPVKGVFSVEPKFSQAGMPHSLCQFDDGTIHTFYHLHIKLPKKFINQNFNRVSDATIKGDALSAKQVFQRALEEISQDSVETTLELIAQNSLHRGAENKSLLESFLAHKKEYTKLESDAQKDLYAWEVSVKATGALTHIRNSSIGTLLVDLSEGRPLDEAVTSYEDKVSGGKYKRSKPIFTEKMAKEAMKTVEELGLKESLPRRHAQLEDISVNNILFINKDAAGKVQGSDDILNGLLAQATSKPKKFSGVEEVSIDKFLKDILPTATSIEAYVESKHRPNFVSLVAPVNKDAKTMLKWNNNFTWGYAGNMADSNMKQNVKSAGGNVDGVLRFSIQWNELGKYNGNDFDAHCVEPNGNRIYYANDHNYNSGGRLDVDIRRPSESKPAVENITWLDINKMQEGTYKFFVHNFSDRGGVDGFRAEIEANGVVSEYSYNNPVREGDQIEVARVTLKDGVFTIQDILSGTQSSVEVWGVNTNNFVPVTVAMHSPNYWDEQQGIGHKHYFFMLKDCLNPDSVNGFFNEQLMEELRPHRKVFEVLGSQMSVKPTEKQLSGLGFSSTKRADLTVKVIGATERVVKIKF